MKLITYQYDRKKYYGLYHQNKVIGFHTLSKLEKTTFPHLTEAFFNSLTIYEPIAEEWDAKFKKGAYHEHSIDYHQVKPLSPIPFPASCRDSYAFRQHVETARRNRDVPMIPEFDQYPVFYFTNHHSIIGSGDVPCMMDHFQQLDFELEAAIVISKKGRNIDAKNADEYIFGYTIMNDLSARVLQMDEMKLNLGPAKGKDFATALGPILVTKDELQQYLTKPPKNHIGENYSLKMTAKVNGIQVSQGNLADMNWTFAEIIERASYGATLHPTDVIGSGTVGTGCFLELNGTAKLNDPNHKPQWLQPNDIVELEITELGTLTNRITAESAHSIIAKYHL